MNPSAAAGLAACNEEQFGLHTAGEPSCPDASKLGEVEVTTPLLTHPLRGGVFLAQQGNLPGNGSNPFGSLLALYLEIQDPHSGVLVKLAGEVKPDPITGQLVTTFLENPQVPFNDLKLSFFGGPRAALVNPPLCGAAPTLYADDAVVGWGVGDTFVGVSDPLRSGRISMCGIPTV